MNATELSAAFTGTPLFCLTRRDAGGKELGEMPEETKQPNTNQEGKQEGGTPPTFDEWLATQDEQIRGLYEQHVSGLKNTVKSTREERDALKTELKDLLPKAEKGSELEKTLTDALAKLDGAEKRAAFYEEAAKPEIGCSNPKMAFLLAQSEALWDRKGNPDWDAIKKAAPELFVKKPPQAHGGAGTGSEPPKGNSMNDWILQKAGLK